MKITAFVHRSVILFTMLLTDSIVLKLRLNMLSFISCIFLSFMNISTESKVILVKYLSLLTGFNSLLFSF